MICLALTFLGVPLVWVLVDGISSLSDLPLKVWTAAVRSIFIALGATLICLLLAFSLLNRNGEMLAILGIAISKFINLLISLGLSWRNWIRWVVWPRLSRPIGFAAGLTAALSLGDFGVIAVFGDAESATLPLKLYQLMGSYRMEQAAGCASLLLILSFGFFWLFDFWGRRNA